MSTLKYLFVMLCIIACKANAQEQADTAAANSAPEIELLKKENDSLKAELKNLRDEISILINKLNNNQPMEQDTHANTAVRALGSKKITLYHLKTSIGVPIPEGTNMFRDFIVAEKKENIKLSAQDAKLLENILLNNHTPPVRIKCPLMAEAGITLTVNGKAEDYAISFTCGNMRRYADDGETSTSIIENDKLRAFIQKYFPTIK
jgi:Icc-related predicted phosphoesterase